MYKSIITTLTEAGRHACTHTYIHTHIKTLSVSLFCFYFFVGPSILESQITRIELREGTQDMGPVESSHLLLAPVLNFFLFFFFPFAPSFYSYSILSFVVYFTLLHLAF